MKPRQSRGSHDCFTLFVSLCRYHLKQGPATIVDKRTKRKECRALINRLLKAIDHLLVKQAMTETHRGNLNNVAHLTKKIFRCDYFTVHPKRLFFLRKSTIMEQMLELCFKLNEEDTLLEWRDSLTETMECFYKEVKAENHADNKELLESWEWLRQIVEEHPAWDSDPDDFSYLVPSGGYAYDSDA